MPYLMTLRSPLSEPGNAGSSGGWWVRLPLMEYSVGWWTGLPLMDTVAAGGSGFSCISSGRASPPSSRPKGLLLLSANWEMGLRTRFLTGQDENQCDNSEYSFSIVTQQGVVLCPPS